MSDLRALLRKYERAQAIADRTGHELAAAIRNRIRTGRRGEAAACARELGWDRRRLHDWMKWAGRDSIPALTGSEADRPASEDNTGTEPNGGSE